MASAWTKRSEHGSRRKTIERNHRGQNEIGRRLEVGRCVDVTHRGEEAGNFGSSPSGRLHIELLSQSSRSSTAAEGNSGAKTLVRYVIVKSVFDGQFDVECESCGKWKVNVVTPSS